MTNGNSAERKRAIELAEILEEQECCQAMGGVRVHPSRCRECPRNAADELRRLSVCADGGKGEAVTDGWKSVPPVMTAAMINAWANGITVTSDKVAERTPFQDAWKRLLNAAPQAECAPRAKERLWLMVADNFTRTEFEQAFAECAPREAKPVAKIDANGDFIWLVQNPKFVEGTEFYTAPTPERAPLNLQAVFTELRVDFSVKDSGKALKAIERAIAIPTPERALREAQPIYLVSSEGRFWQIVSEPVWINWQADYRNVLYTAPREAQPDGWKLMPMIPTVEMTVAALAVTDSPCTAYALFLDAAPTPERAQLPDLMQTFPDDDMGRRGFVSGWNAAIGEVAKSERADAEKDAALTDEDILNKEPQP